MKVDYPNDNWTWDDFAAANGKNLDASWVNSVDCFDSRNSLSRVLLHQVENYKYISARDWTLTETYEKMHFSL